MSLVETVKYQKKTKFQVLGRIDYRELRQQRTPSLLSSRAIKKWSIAVLCAPICLYYRSASILDLTYIDLTWLSSSLMLASAPRKNINSNVALCVEINPLLLSLSTSYL